MRWTAGVLALAPAIGLAVCMAVHVIVSRTLPGLPRIRGIALSFAGGAIAVAGMIVGGRTAPLLAAASLWDVAAVWFTTYTLLIYCYVIGFFNLGESARRIRLLIELHGAGERGMTLAEILSRYSARTIVEVRLRRMVAGGQIRERAGAYFIATPVMLTAARLLTWLKLAYLGARSETGVAPP